MSFSVDAALREANVSLPVQGRSVLVVDDEPGNLATMQALLEDPWEVHTAGSAQEALALLAAGLRVDLVIADQRMPRMSGVQLLSHIAERSPEIMRILLTAYADVEPMLDAANRGAVFAFVVKPCEPAALRSMVAEALRMKHQATLLQTVIEAYTARRAALSGTLRELQAVQEHVLVAERMTAVGQAASGIVHNLRNLSGIMCVLVDKIRKKTSHEPLLESAQASLDSLQSLLKLLEYAREFARVGDGAVSLAPTDTRRLLQGTAAVALMQTEDTKCPLHVHTDPEIRQLMVDADRLTQALVALLDNAIRASEPGRPIHLTVRSVPHDGSTCAPPTSVCFQVADSGSGMDAATLARATEPFFSAFSPPRLGLGLETAQLVARAHGGCLQLTSTPGRGTVACLVVPVKGGTPS